MSVAPELVLDLASYFSIIHHTNGRLRLKVDPKIKNKSNNIEQTDIKNLIDSIKGIKSVKINSLVGTITILYNPSVFPPQLWEDFVNKRNTNEILDMIESIVKEIKT